MDHNSRLLLCTMFLSPAFSFVYCYRRTSPKRQSSLCRPYFKSNPSNVSYSQGSSGDRCLVPTQFAFGLVLACRSLPLHALASSQVSGNLLYFACAVCALFIALLPSLLHLRDSSLFRLRTRRLPLFATREVADAFLCVSSRVSQVLFHGSCYVIVESSQETYDSSASREIRVCVAFSWRTPQCARCGTYGQR